MPANVYSWTKESQIWGEMRRHFFAPDLHLQRIESPLTGSGQPDIEGCYQGIQVWIESKIVRGGKVKISDRQEIWHRKRAASGGISWILAWNNADKTIYLWLGRHAVFVQQDGTRFPPYQRFPCPIDWPSLREALFVKYTEEEHDHD